MRLREQVRADVEVPLLGTKKTMMDYVLILMGAVFLITYGALQISLRRLVGRLKQIDMLLWVGMGSPTPTYFTRFKDYTTSRPAGLNAPVTEYSDLSMWLDHRRYEPLNDVEITTNAVRYMLLRKVQLAAIAFTVCVILYKKFG
jgi:hypothetical protein